MRIRDSLVFLAALAGLVSCGGSDTPKAVPVVNPTKPASQDFVQRQGKGLAVAGAPYRIRGITFASDYYGATGDSITDPLLDHDHNAGSYAEVAGLGMNVVQLILSYKAFEDDGAPFDYKADGWQWLDDNVAQAKASGLRVVFDLLTVAGGAWHDQSAGAQTDYRFWTDPGFRQRYTALWKAIAARYADEPAVAAYSLLNEPVTADADGETWWSLAQDTLTAIRTVDDKHLIILNPLAGVNQRYYVPSEVTSRILLSDPNILYDIHLYVPHEYALQGATWDTSAPADGGVYPDESIVEVIGNTLYVADDSENSTPNSPLPAGDSDWQLLTGQLYKVTSSDAVIGYPSVQCRHMTSAGVACFDDFVVNEYDENDALLGPVSQGTVTQTSRDSGPWSYWSSDGNGVFGVAADGHADAQSLTISGDSALALWTNPSSLFQVTPGHSYQISGWAKGTGIDAKAQCRFGLYLYKPAPDGAAGRRDHELLEAVVTNSLAFGEQHTVPMIFSEFGLTRVCYGASRGGITWLSDMVTAFDQHDANYLFFVYHNSFMGIYGDENQWPNASIEIPEILAFFKSHLK